MLKASRLFVFGARDCLIFTPAHGREGNVGDKVGNIDKLTKLTPVSLTNDNRR